MSANPHNFATTESIGTLMDQTVFHNFMTSVADQ